MTESSDRAEVERLARASREAGAGWRALKNEAEGWEYRYHLGLLTPSECGKWVHERGSLARRTLDAEERFNVALRAYREALSAFYARYVQGRSACPSPVPFRWGMP